MFKVYVIVRDDNGKTYKKKLDGVLYPDKVSAYIAQGTAMTEDHIEDKFDIVRWEFEEV